MKVSRRDFAKGAALLPVMLSATPAVAETQPALAPALQAEAEARIQWILGKYGSRFTDEQKADIRRIITGSMGGYEALRAYPLDNAVEPATTFEPKRSARKRPERVTTNRKAQS